MRTVLVNPRRRSKSRKHTRAAKVIVVRANGSPALPNPSRRRRRRKASGGSRRIVMLASPKRRRAGRRNPAPMIMPNPRGRRRRRNPGFSLMGGIKTLAVAGGSALGAYLINKYALANIGHNEAEHWNSPANRNGVLMRTGIRAAVAVAASFLLPGSLGAAFGGAMLYPGIGEMQNWYAYRNAGVGAGAVDMATPYDQTRTPAQIGAPTAVSADFEADLATQLDRAGRVYG